MLSDLPTPFASLRAAYARGRSPVDVIADAFDRLDQVGDPGIFLHADRDGALAAARALDPAQDLPLWGIPFAVKDNIDVAGLPTTAACPDFSYVAEADAAAVARLRAAGAICLGKTNLDQFATGLVGTRSPYPVPKNALDPAIVPGGSSSGSAVAVAHGIAAFALGTDTAGSGRVPAALNGIVGLKPTLGAVSARGMVPACRTLDTISVFAATVADAEAAFAVMRGFDATDAYSKPLPPEPAIGTVPAGLRIGVPDADTLETCGDTVQAGAFHATLELLRQQGATIVPKDFSPFYATAQMLYEGAWVAERCAAVGERLTRSPETLHPVTRAILEPGLALTAVDAFRGQYRLAELRRVCEQALAAVDLLCVPTIPCFVTLAEDRDDPIGYNARLGTYTNFVNLLDMAGIAVPTGRRADARPASCTFLAGQGRDGLVAAVAKRVEDRACLPAPRTLSDSAARPVSGARA
ncbi:allophanate hydrolase [Pseudooceanicola lipolyticus]|uniref:Allophanate hydrolase n=1 Tax=Pseudooceanicola lipolyticus TaxID=2029104 RepID=A0A2M8IWP8_9RHOB|nr:allophanate hydrolase [Pseudooceanicola lipolyticus]PJE34965.1 allophanate hydrolase [Pseudooceanicola lipolyticus]